MYFSNFSYAKIFTVVISDIGRMFNFGRKGWSELESN